MYLLMIVLTLLILPLVSILFEMTVAGGDAGLMLLVGKWFVFWAGGLRLLLASLSQIFNPGYTARSIFDIKDPQASKIVTELGFGNFSIGTISALSLLFPAWLLPAAVAGGLFYGLAGIKHVFNQRRSPKENIALASDLFVFVVLAAFVLWSALRADLLQFIG